MKKILIIDDEQLILTSLTTLFRRSGFDVAGSIDAHEGIRIGKQYYPDILIIDWMLSSDISCLDVIDAIEKLNPDTKIVVMSGYPKLEITAKLKEKEVAIVCEKPVEFNDLLILINKLISADE